MRYCHVTEGGHIRFQIWRYIGGSVATANIKSYTQQSYITQKDDGGQTTSEEVGNIQTTKW